MMNTNERQNQSGKHDLSPTPLELLLHRTRHKAGDAPTAVSCTTKYSSVASSSACTSQAVVSNNSTPLPDAMLKDLAMRAQASVQDKFKDHNHHNNNNDDDDGEPTSFAQLPRFHLDEIQLGRTLGRGQFGTVAEICSIILSTDSPYSQAREALQKHCIRADGIREGDSRFAIKLLQTQHTTDCDVFYTYYRDMLLEIQVLASLDHRNIVKLRGLSNSCPQSFFILDRLYGTLKESLADWKTMQKRFNRPTSSLTGILMNSQLRERKREFLEFRLRCLRDIASAIVYLHDKSIIQRDIKPDNIGFDLRGEVKLFDFGLSTPIPKTDHDNSKVTLYQLTAMTGSLRYMAPENYCGLPYNQSIDIYAFSIIVWQVLTLQHLYPNFQKQMVIDLVILRGVRPELNTRQSPNMQTLLKGMWNTDVAARPTAKHVLHELQRELEFVQDAKNSESGESDDDHDNQHNNHHHQQDHHQQQQPQPQQHTQNQNLHYHPRHRHRQINFTIDEDLTEPSQAQTHDILASHILPSRKARRHRAVDVASLALARDMQNEFRSLKKIKDRSKHYKVYPRCFLRSDAMDWLVAQVKSHNAPETPLSEEQAIEIAALLGNELINQGYLSHVSNEHLFDPTDSHSVLFFRFHEHFMDSNYKRCSFGSLTERDTDQLQSELFARFTQQVVPEANMAKPERTALPNKMFLWNKVQSDLASFRKSQRALMEEPEPEEEQFDSEPLMPSKSTLPEDNNATKSQKRSSLVTLDTHNLKERILLFTENRPDSFVKPVKHIPVRHSGKSEAQVDVSLLSIAQDMHIDFGCLHKIKDRMWYLKKYKQCFLHIDAMEWLIRQVKRHYYERRPKQPIHDDQVEQAASYIGNLLIKHGYITPLGSDHRFDPDDLDATLFFKFDDDVFEQDYNACCYGSWNRENLEKLQGETFYKTVIETLEQHQRLIDEAKMTALAARNKGVTLPNSMYVVSKAQRELSALLADKEEVDKTETHDDGNAMEHVKQRRASLVKVMTKGSEEKILAYSRTPLSESAAVEKTRVSSVIKNGSQRRMAGVDMALLSIVRDLQSDFSTAKKIKDRMYHLRIYKRTFLRIDVMEWLTKLVKRHFYEHVGDFLQQHGREPRLSQHQAQTVAASIGNKMIEQGYMSIVGHDNFLHMDDNEDSVLLKFHERLIEDDFNDCALGLLDDEVTYELQEDLFFRFTIDTINSYKNQPTKTDESDTLATLPSTHTGVLPNSMYLLSKMQNEISPLLKDPNNYADDADEEPESLRKIQDSKSQRALLLSETSRRRTSLVEVKTKGPEEKILALSILNADAHKSSFMNRKKKKDRL